MKTLLKLLKPYTKLLIINAITDAIGTFSLILMPYAMSYIVDEGVATGNLTVLWGGAVVMLVLSIISIIGSLIANSTNSRLTTGYTADLFKATFKKINSLSYNQYSKIGPSGLLTRATDDIWNIEGMASTVVYTLVTIPIMLIGSAVLAFLADVVLALIFMAVIPVVVIIVFLLVKPEHEMWEKSDKYVDEQNKIVRERLSGLRVVRAFNNEDKEHLRAKTATEEMAKYMIRANVRSGFIEPIAMLLLNFATVIMVAVSGNRASLGLMNNAGDIIAIVQYVALLTGALINLSWTLSWLPRLKVSVTRICEIHSFEQEDIPLEENETENKAVAFNGESSNFDLEFNGVNFTYPESKIPTLTDVNFKIKTGERVAIIGGTGSGKTTLVKLILGLFEPDCGSISIGEKDYGKVDKVAVRKHFSVAMQKPMIFEGTIKENIKMGNPDAEDGQISSALKACQMENFINDHKEGMDYFLVGGGQNVSGGQKQRISMARTVIRRADVYIFDDSFSALDYLTESVIRANLKNRLKDKTQIIVTQRVSTALSAQRIFVMDGGKIVDEGTHDSLLKTSKIYREICVSQLGKDILEGGENE